MPAGDGVGVGTVPGLVGGTVTSAQTIRLPPAGIGAAPVVVTTAPKGALQLVPLPLSLNVTTQPTGGVGGVAKPTVVGTEINDELKL